MWRYIRIFGALQILTRASYLALVAVPIVAGVWPAVTLFVSGYAERAVAAGERVEKSLAEFRSLAEGVGAEEAAQSVEAVRQELRSSASSLTKLLLGGISMPVVWAYAYFGSLLVTIGHAVYQSFAPQDLQESSKAVYKQTAVDDYEKRPTAVKLESAARSLVGNVVFPLPRKDSLASLKEDQSPYRAFLDARGLGAFDAMRTVYALDEVALDDEARSRRRTDVHLFSGLVLAHWGNQAAFSEGVPAQDGSLIPLEGVGEALVFSAEQYVNGTPDPAGDDEPSALPSFEEALKHVKQSHLEMRGAQDPHFAGAQAARAILIEKAASMDYEGQARESYWMAVCAAVLYTGGLLCVARVVLEQAEAVLRACS